MTKLSPTPDNNVHEWSSWLKSKWFWIKSKSSWRRFVGCILILLIILMLAIVFWYGGTDPKSQFSELMSNGLGLKNKNEILSFLVPISGGLIVLMSTLALISRAESQDKIAEAQNKTAVAQNETATAQKETAAATLEANRQAIFESGITNLGNPSESVRLGGIYTLYELAVKEPFRAQNIIEILCAHLRAKTQEPKYQKFFTNRQPSNEIASLLLLLTGEKSEPLKKALEECRLDFSGAFLKKANLKKARLHRAYLPYVQLQGADLSEAQLQETDLSHAQLQEAVLSEAQLQKAHLWEAQLQGARLWETQLQKAGLWGAQLQKASLWRAQLQGADLSEAQLQEADLSEAQLQNANLSIAELHDADLSSAQLQRAGLSKARLLRANLSKAQLQGANLSEAQLQGANLSGAKLHGAYAHTLDGDAPSLLIVENNIKDRTGEDTDLSTAVFSEGTPEENKAAASKALENADRGILEQEMADQIIADYHKAMKDVPA
ncbi:MAG: pentapeptide repeat-containing protein [Pseudohongiellaceae bacterium]